MAFRIASSRPKKMQKRIAAFDDTGEDDSNIASGSKEGSAALDASAQTWIDKGAMFAEAGDAAAALRCWDQAALIQPANAKVHEMRAQILNDLDRTFEAVQAAQQAVSSNPDWPDAHITLARVQLNLGEPQLALQSYQTAARLQPGHPDLLQELPAAQMYAKLHRQQPAGTRAHVTGQHSSRPAAFEPQAAVEAEDAAAAAIADVDVEASKPLGSSQQPGAGLQETEQAATYANVRPAGDVEKAASADATKQQHTVVETEGATAHGQQGSS